MPYLSLRACRIGSLLCVVVEVEVKAVGRETEEETGRECVVVEGEEEVVVKMVVYAYL